VISVKLEHRKGTGLGGTGAVSGPMQNGIHPRRSETDMPGPRGTGACLAVSRGKKMAWLVCRDGLGRKCCRNRPAWRDMACKDFSILNSLFQLNKSTVENKNRTNN
jgi:hypothetical protein